VHAALGGALHTQLAGAARALAAAANAAAPLHAARTESQVAQEADVGGGAVDVEDAASVLSVVLEVLAAPSNTQPQPQECLPALGGSGAGSAGFASVVAATTLSAESVHDLCCRLWEALCAAVEEVHVSCYGSTAAGALLHAHARVAEGEVRSGGEGRVR